MVREIVTYGDPVLRGKCRSVVEPAAELESLAADMVETMRVAGGVGLAAPQIGVPIQLAVVDVSHDPACVSYLRVDGAPARLADWMPLVFTNPSLAFGDARESDDEGCLSIPEVKASVVRPADLRATLRLLDGREIVLETDGLLARVIQHETDHLHGILFIDRISTAAKVRLRGTLKRMLAEPGPKRYLPSADKD